MNAKTFYTLAGVAIVALIAALMMNKSKKPLSDTSQTTKYIVPALHDHVNDLTSITLTGAENKVIATLKRGENGWNVVEKNNYTADTTKLRELLLKLSDATIMEAKTSNKDKYADLGVNEVANKDAKGVLVTLEGLAKPVKLIVGNYNGSGGGGTFMRHADENQSYLVRGNISVDKTTANWLKRDLTDLPAKRFKEVAITNAEGKLLKIYKDNPADANFKVADVPKGRELSSPSVADGIAAVFTGFRFDDVLPAKEAEPTDKTHKAHYVAFDGLIVDAQAWEKEGKDYLRLTASLDTTQAESHIKAAQEKAKTDYETQVTNANKESTDPKPATESSAPKNKTSETPKPLAVSDPQKYHDEQLAGLNKEITTLNQLFNGWTFVIPNYKFSTINKTTDDMLKPLEQKAPDIKEAIKKK